MDTKLTKGNQKNVALPAPIHAQIVALSMRDDLPMWRVVAKALDLYQVNRSLFNGGDDAKG